MDYRKQAKLLYGKTDAYQEYAQIAKSRNADQEKDLGSQVMDFFCPVGQNASLRA